MKTLAALLLVVPLTSEQGWQVLRYDGIPAHIVRFSESGLAIHVNRSAAPVIYPLPTARTVRSVRAIGRVSGALKVPAGRQGQRGFDDYTFRLGLVEVGHLPPGFAARRFAPAWVRKLLPLLPVGTGIARVQFFNVGISDEQKGQRRRHPLSRLLHEQVVAAPESNGYFDVHETLDPPAEIAAIWIGADGDDTRSSFVMTLERLVLEAD